ncbi:MAG: hydrogenase 3 maturation endopeptidase HyCI [Bellilinea sp.]|jgi:hydrogenase 3 maturation protease
MKTSSPSWLEQLRSLLNRPVNKARAQPENAPFRVAMIGIGNEFNGDDAAGVLVARALRKRCSNRPDRLILEGGTAPENFTGALRHFQPDLAVLVDCAAMDEPPGAVALLDWDQLDGFGASTHTLPPTMLADFLLRDMGCAVALIGIQPAGLDFDAPLSPPVRAAVRQVSRGLIELLELGS